METVPWAWFSAPPPIVPPDPLTKFGDAAPPPPEMVAAVTPAFTWFPWYPPIMFGVPVVGSKRKARCPFTFSSSACSSVVPKKFTAGLVAALPVRDQASVEPGKPCGPCGPSGPTGPSGPVAPVKPMGPCGPVSPIVPCGPCAPVAPASPFWANRLQLELPTSGAEPVVAASATQEEPL